MRLQGVWRGLGASVALVGLAACGTSKIDSGGAPVTIAPVTTATPTTPVATVTVTMAPTTVPTTTVAPTTAPTTTAAPSTLPTTTAATLPQPQAPPNPNALEPAIQIGTIAIPKIQLLHSMWEGITDSTLNRGPGHWPGTAMP